MIWITWRQHRSEIIPGGVLFLLVLLCLLITGSHIATEAHLSGFDSCFAHPTSCASLPAQGTLETFILNQAFGSPVLYNAFQLALLALPLLAGMFLGVQVVARELEEETYRLAWTQSLSRTRWFLSKTALLAVTLLVPSCILYAVFSWWKVPVLLASSNPWSYDSYDVWGIVALAYMLFALVLGLCAGTLLRKTVPAMAVTLVIFVALRIVIEVFFRANFLPPVTTTVSANNAALTSPFPFQSLPFGSTQELINHQGQQVSLPANIKSLCLAQTDPQDTSNNNYNQCLAAHGFQLIDLLTYQPADRFWLFQAIESGIYLALALCLFALTFWWVRYRLS